MATLDVTSAPLDAATALSAPPAGVAAQPADDDTGDYELPTGTLRHTPFDAIQRRMGGQFAEWEGWDWISDFGEPVAEHHAVRETVGLWDESPLQKWLFRGPDALAAADYCFTSDMAGLAVGQVRYGPFCDERGRMLGDGTVYNTGDNEKGILVVTALSTDGDHFRRAAAAKGLDVEVVEVHRRDCRTCSSRARSRASCCSRSRTPTSAPCATSGSSRTSPSAASRAASSPAPATRASSATRSTRQPENAERLWSALLDPGQSLGLRPYGLAAVESLRIESGLIFIGFDYFPAYTSPFHMNLERMIKLDKADFIGKEALVAEHAAGITHRMVTLVIAGEEAPEYNTPVYRHGREVGKLLSPSAGRSPTVDRLIGMACIETELTEVGTPLEVALPDGRTVPALVDRFPIYDPEKTRPRV